MERLILGGGLLTSVMVVLAGGRCWRVEEEERGEEDEAKRLSVYGQKEN